MGLLQNRPEASEEQVWENVQTRGDYNSSGEEREHTSEPYADYVFGRMMKFGLRIHGKDLVVHETELRPDYQEWCHKYPTYKALIDAAVVSLQPADTRPIAEVVPGTKRDYIDPARVTPTTSPYHTTGIQPAPKAPAIDKALTSITGKDRPTEIKAQRCVTCGEPATTFKDEVSRKEYAISGMCQSCQDDTFTETPW